MELLLKQNGGDIQVFEVAVRGSAMEVLHAAADIAAKGPVSKDRFFELMAEVNLVELRPVRSTRIE